MSGPLFEQYKAALRQGHLSALAGNLDEALDAYREAARLVPERALPLASQGTLLHRLDRWPEAAAVFDAALRLAPDDEATLRARASAREERGMASGAAADFERLAFVLDVAGRGHQAAEAARHANELEPSAARAGLAERLAIAATPMARSDSQPGAETSPSPPTDPTATADGRDADDGALEPELDGGALESAEADARGPEQLPGPDIEPGPELDLDAEDLDLPPPPRIVAETDAEAARHANATDPAASWPALDMPSPPPPPMVGPPPDTEQLMGEAGAMYEAGDAAGAAERMLTAVAVHRAAGRLDAALDVCFQLLAIAPGDPQAHLAIANLQLDRGWTPLAREKIDLLARLTGLTGDTQAEADVHGLAAERLRDAPMGAAAAR